MQVLIVEENPDLGAVWQRHLERHGLHVKLTSGYEAAIAYLHESAVNLIVLDLNLVEGSALDLADYANYRYPEVPVIFVSNSTFFSDGSIFQHVENARAFVAKDVAPADLFAMVEHFGKAP